MSILSGDVVLWSPRKHYVKLIEFLGKGCGVWGLCEPVVGMISDIYNIVVVVVRDDLTLVGCADRERCGISQTYVTFRLWVLHIC